MAIRFEDDTKPKLKTTPFLVEEYLDTPEAQAAYEQEAKRSRGRPAKHADEPWVAAGISKRTWYRRQKASK